MKEISAISFLSLSEYEGYYSNFSYSARCKIGDGQEPSIHFDDDDGIDSYNFSLFTDVSELEISNSAVTDITAISNSSIENLTLDNNNEIADYTSLSQMTKLNKLTIQFFSQHYSDIDVTNITQKSGIEKLEFKNANIL